MKNIITSLVLCLMTLQLVAQTPKSFPEPDDEFLLAFGEYVNKSKREASALAMADFSNTFNGLNSGLKTDVKATANAMLKNKVRNYPTYTDYVSIITTIVAKSAEGESTNHITILKELILASKPSAYKHFERYIKYLPKLFDENLLYGTATKSWNFNEGASYKVSVEEGKAVLKFSSLDLIGKSKKDSVIIKNTSGSLYPVAKKWSGNGGNSYFSRAGWGENEASIELGQYNLKLDKNEMRFDSVYFTMPEHIDGKVLGSYQDKLFSTIPATISFPKFASYDVNINIKNLDDRVTAFGGFQLSGEKIYIFGSHEKYASIILKTGGKKQMVASSDRFLFKHTSGEIVSDNAQIILYMKKDSIFHPSLIFKYLTESNYVRLQKGEKLKANLTWESGYHQTTVALNGLEWNLDSTKINLVHVAADYTKAPVKFTSYDHYVPQGELRYLTLTGRNPLRMVRDLSDSYGTDYLNGEDLAGMLGYPLKEVESIIYKLTKDGFVYYDPVTKAMTVSYKTHHYMLAGADEVDYDNLEFISNPRGGKLNGIIDLETQDIEIYGVKEFELSRLSQVTIRPKEEKMILTEDRNIDMEGELQAGKLKFRGRGIHFNYENFKADMEEVDSLIIYIAGPMNELGEVKDVPLKSVISGIKGTLYIDEPNNKSGILDYQEYPYFVSEGVSYVYFDDAKDSTKFPRDKFYFEVAPFKLDSITSSITDSISFKGKLVTNDIFNPYETYLTIQEDRSLGVNEWTSVNNGIGVYKGSGKFFENFRLSKQDGLTGSGKIEYRQARVFSDNFIFLDDSMYAEVDTFKILESASADVPQVYIDDAIVWWNPYEDQMYLYAEGRDNLMYNNELKYNGNLSYKGGALYGTSDSGVLSNFVFNNAILDASDAEFKKDYFTSEDVNMVINDEGGDTELLIGTNLTANVNFTDGTGDFEIVSDTTFLDIPLNKLASNMKNFRWDMNNGKVLFQNNEAGDLYFLSLLEEYDSIKIFAGTAELDLVENKLIAMKLVRLDWLIQRLFHQSKN